MSNKVKVKVSDSHFKNSFQTGKTKIREGETKEVEVTAAVRNAVKARNLVLVEGSLGPEKTEKSFQEDDGSGKKGEKADGDKALKDYTKDELKEMCEEEGLKKSGTKDELIERLKNQ